MIKSKICFKEEIISIIKRWNSFEYKSLNKLLLLEVSAIKKDFNNLLQQLDDTELDEIRSIDIKEYQVIGNLHARIDKPIIVNVNISYQQK